MAVAVAIDKIRTCCRCELQFPLRMFTIRYKNGRKHGIQSHCKECQRKAELKSLSRPEYRKIFNARRKERWVEKAKRIHEYLKHHPCVDCGEKNAIILQFDHVRGIKQFSIGKKIRDKSWATVMREVRKCEVRCVNCHLKRSASQMGINTHKNTIENRKMVSNFKKYCVDCGEVDKVVLQFDHVRGEKVANVSALCHRGRWEDVYRSILGEIAKCEVRCGSCHLLATIKRNGYKSWAVAYG